MPPQGWGLGAVGVVGAIKIVEGSIEESDGIFIPPDPAIRLQSEASKL